MTANDLVELFASRARAVAARVSVVKDEASVERLVSEERARLGDDKVGVACAARGIAETGTCVVETDDEETRLATMIPETSVIVLKTSDIVPHLADVRDRQKDGKVAYTSFITGPSRTADIERVGAIGVHGPLEVHVILLED